MTVFEFVEANNNHLIENFCYITFYTFSLLLHCTKTYLKQDPKLFDKLFSKHGEQLEEKSLTICSGVDYTNINYQHVVCPDSVTAKVMYANSNRGNVPFNCH